MSIQSSISTTYYVVLFDHILLRENRVYRAAVTAQSTNLWQPQLGATWANIDIYGRSEKSGLLL